MARKPYSDQFKRDAVKLMTEQGYSLSKASAALGGVAERPVDVEDDAREQADLEEELARLRKENQQLRMEREI